MLDFHYPTIEDKSWVDELLSFSQFQGCEYSFGNIFIWQEPYNSRIARYKDFFISKVGSKDFTYCFPAGKGDLSEVINAIKNDADECNHTFRISSLSTETIKLLEDIMPNQFEYTSSDKSFDYIYSTEDLINLPGRKFHGKRNHISFFEKNYNWSYEPINEDNLEECFKMNAYWESQKSDIQSKGISNELIAINSAFDNFFALGLIGGLLRIDGKVVAYTIGEKLTDNTFCTHIEKADAEIRGSYPMINREFAKNALSDYDFVNREEDLGVPGLRKAKMSYNPIYLLEKYTAIYKGNL